MGHLLYMARFRVLLKVLLHNRIGRKAWPVAVKAVIWSLGLSPLRWLQRGLYSGAVRRIRFEEHPPTFLVGHFRSGTTFLHYLLSQDHRWATPSNLHGVFINYCLLFNRGLTERVGSLFPRRRPMDNVSVSIDKPQEEEQSLCCLSARAALMDYFFPKSGHYFRKYGLMEQMSKKERAGWRKHYQETLRITAYSLQNPRLLLKNPHNTSRIRELHELFPDARFIFIIRNPYDLYRSIRHWYDSFMIHLSWQTLSEAELEDRIFRLLRLMLKKYLQERDLLPRRRLYEVRYEDLIRQPEQRTSELYEHLQLPPFEEAAPAMRAHLESLSDYRTNRYAKLEPRLRKRIEQEWGFIFEEWGYEKEGEP